MALSALIVRRATNVLPVGIRFKDGEVNLVGWCLPREWCRWNVVKSINAGSIGWLAASLLAILSVVLAWMLLRARRSETELRQRVDIYHMFGDHFPLVFYIARSGAPWTVHYISERVADLTGYPPDAFLDDPELWVSLVHPDDISIAKDLDAKLLHAKVPIDIEYRIVTRSQEVKWVCDRTVPVLDGDGYVQQIVGLVDDITERKRIEQRLREREAMLSKAEELANIGSFTWNVVDDTLTWSDNMFAIAGLSPETFDGNLSDVMSNHIHPKDREAVVNQIAEMVVQRVVTPMLFRFVRDDGEVRWLQSNGEFVFNEAGEPVVCVGLHRDITEEHKLAAALEESQHFMASVVSTIPSLLYIYDVDEDRNVWVNDVHRNTFTALHTGAGQPEDLTQYLHPEDAPAIMARLAALKEAGDGVCLDVEYRMRGTATTWRWFYDRASVFARHEDGAVHQLIGSAVDITELREALEAVEATRDFFNRTFEAVQEGIWVTDRDHVIRFVNRAMVGFSGESKSDILGLSVLSDLVGEAWRAFREVYDRAYRRLQPESYEVTLTVDATGEARVFSGWLTPLVTEGQFDGMICTASDVTEAGAAAEALRRSEERFNRFMQFLPAAVFIKDRAGRLIYANEEFARVAGQTLRSLLDEGVERTIPEDLARQYEEENHAVLVEQQLMELESSYPGPEGMRDWLTYKFPIYWGEGVMYVGGISFDITERNRIAAQLRAAVREKTVLLQEIHHRVKNNLAVVDSLLGLQAMGLQNLIAQRALEESQRRVRAMARVHEHLYQAPNLSRVAMDDYVPVLVRALYKLVGQDDITLNVQVDALQLTIDRAIPCALILNELVSNAFKHGFPILGGKSISREDGAAVDRRVSVVLRSQDGRVYLEVSNTGEPLPDDFDLFTSDSLGLVVIRLLIEQLGGRIAFERGSPTVFTASFPISSETKEDEVVSVDKGHACDEVDGGAPRIMIVEDEGILAEMTRRLLGRWGYNVVAIFHAGETAVAQVADLKPDVVIIDVRLSGKMKGDEAARQIVAQYPAAILFTTGYGGQQGAPEEIGLVCTTLSKPVPPPLLQKTIADLVKQVRRARDGALDASCPEQRA